MGQCKEREGKERQRKERRRKESRRKEEGVDGHHACDTLPRFTPESSWISLLGQALSTRTFTLQDITNTTDMTGQDRRAKRTEAKGGSATKGHTHSSHLTTTQTQTDTDTLTHTDTEQRTTNQKGKEKKGKKRAVLVAYRLPPLHNIAVHTTYIVYRIESCRIVSYHIISY